ncbi:MAG: uroporphyrinogen-III C-methyltransferase [Salinarimonas sp.]|nr:uroporphyrinogen-III C-methyltransferase [Salinarimonas sp.]
MSATPATGGHITMIGAGPGDPDLLTIRAVKRIEAADVILFDDLGAGPLLKHARAQTELIAVGKRAGRVSPKQSQVSRLMVAHAKMGQRVVRLKSGDPTIFGRLDEEIVAAREAGIPFEIVPGVTAATAAAAELGFSLTKRGVARRLQFVTGHDVDGQLPSDLDIAALADPGATTCVFMGKATFALLVEALIARGLCAETPCVVAAQASLPDASARFGTLRDIADYLAGRPQLGASVIFYGAAIPPEPVFGD